MHSKYVTDGAEAEVKPDCEDLYCLAGLYTRPHRRGRGMARLLMNAIEHDADREDVDLWLVFEPGDDTDPDRLRALYRSASFVPATELTTYRWRQLRRAIGPFTRRYLMYRPRRSRRVQSRCK